MMNVSLLRCDGCGQLARAEHISRRLQRLEWATRYRPIHISTLFLGAVAPANDSEFLYAGNMQTVGEAALVLHAAGINRDGRSPEAALTDFQRGGFFLAHVVECAPEGGTQQLQTVVQQRLKPIVARIRRSLKPKRLVPISRGLQPLLQFLKPDDLGCAVVLDHGKEFDIDSEQSAARLRETLAAASAAR